MNNSESAIRAGLFLSVLTLLLFFASSKSSHAYFDDSPTVSTATREGRLAVFDDVWETIEERYYDPTFRGIDWQQKRLTYRPLVAEAGGTQQFYELLRQMLAPLRDPHTRVYSPEEKFDWWIPKFVTVGITVREVQGLPTVVHVEQHSAAARAGVRAGDVIVKIDHETVSEVLGQRLAALASPVDTLLRTRTTTSLLEGTAGSLVKLTLENHQGKIREIALQRAWTERRLGFQITKDGPLAIVRIDVFTPTISKDLLRALPDALRRVDGVIIDLRANGGGDAQAMAEVASAFFSYPVDLGTFTDRSAASFNLQTSFKMITSLPPAGMTKIPMTILIGEGTSSAAEILAAALQSRGRARVFGNRTCGCVLAIRSRHELPDGGVLDVSELDYRTPEGLRLEGVGVVPDDSIGITRRDLYKGRDAVLESAKAYLKKHQVPHR